jgi:hypothetical protein
MNQVAKLFLRGKLMNKTARDLSPEQVKEVEKYIDIVWSDPALARTKTAFCSKLAWTIGNEYHDLEAGMQEVWIVYWKTTVDILFHRPKQEMQRLIQATCAKCCKLKTNKCNPCDGTGILNGNCPECFGRGYTKTMPEMVCGCGTTATLDVSEDMFSMSMSVARETYRRITGNEAPARDLSIIENPIQRHKFYKTTLWNYLRQIVNENKPRTSTYTTTIKEYAEKIALRLVKDIVDEFCKISSRDASKDSAPQGSKKWWSARYSFHEAATIEADTNLISLHGVMRLRELQDQMISNNVEIVLQPDAIVIQKTGTTSILVASIQHTAQVSFLSLTPPTSESGSTYLYPNVFVEPVAPPATISELETNESLAAVRRKLGPIEQKIFDIIIEPPDEYAGQYSTNPVRRSNVSKFLNLSKSEVDTAWAKIERATIAAGLKS